MNRTYFLVIVTLSIASAFLAAASMWKEVEAPLGPSYEVTYSDPPFPSYISASGIVEASSDNISIGIPIQRIIEEVYVKAGQEIKQGQLLLQLDSKDLQADLVVRQKAYEVALAKVSRLEAFPQEDDILLAETSMKSAEVELTRARMQYEMTQGLQTIGALSREEVEQRRLNCQRADVKWQEAKAQLDKIKKGSWEPDLEITRLEALQAKASVDRLQAEIDRTQIRSPIDGKVLQIKIHKGELPPVDTFQTPVLVIGNTHEKHLEVSINQYNVSYFKPEAKAVAYLQGDSKFEFPLEFIQVEPYLVSKKNITNDISEKIDTRVLVATYRFKKPSKALYVGQQMDVFIEAER